MKPAKIQVVEQVKLNACNQPTATDRPTDLVVLFFNSAGEIYSKDRIDRQNPDDLDRFKRFRQLIVSMIDEGKAKMSPLFYSELGYEVEII